LCFCSITAVWQLAICCSTANALAAAAASLCRAVCSLQEAFASASLACISIGAQGELHCSTQMPMFQVAPTSSAPGDSSALPTAHPLLLRGVYRPLLCEGLLRTLWCLLFFQTA
jgi:hypothetical protein